MPEKSDHGETGAMILSDDGILDLLARDEPEGIELLYEHYSRIAYTLAFRVLNDAPCCQGSSTRLSSASGGAPPPTAVIAGSMGTWVCSIVHHRALDQLRGRAGRGGPDMALDHMPTAVTSAWDPWDQVVQGLEREQVRRALSELSIEQRETIAFAYFGGYSQIEISDLMCVLLGTVKGRTQLAVRKLRGLLPIPAAEGRA